MVFAKTQWFKMRKYGGWGVTPKTWQGWVYVCIMIIPMIIIQKLSYFDETSKIYITAAWLVFLLIEFFHIMIKLKKDEREQIHEGLSDRNAAWMMIFVLVLGLIYDFVNSNGNLSLNPFVIAALVLGALVKSITFIYLERKS